MIRAGIFLLPEAIAMVLAVATVFLLLVGVAGR